MFVQGRVEGVGGYRRGRRRGVLHRGARSRGLDGLERVGRAGATTIGEDLELLEVGGELVRVGAQAR
jgi:hypothetical protein